MIQPTPGNLILLPLLCICTYTDLRHGKIHNLVTYTAVAAGLGAALAVSGIEGLSLSFAGLLCAFLPAFLFYMLGGFGGGDVKLLAAVGAAGGYPFILPAMYYSAMAGGALAVILMLTGFSFASRNGPIYRNNKVAITTGEKGIEGTGRRRPRVPAGLAISVGTGWALIERAL